MGTTRAGDIGPLRRKRFPSDSSPVIASYYFLERDFFDAMEYEDVDYDDLMGEAMLCASNFTEFMYRFWVENTIWYSLRDGLPLTAAQEEYRRQITRKL